MHGLFAKIAGCLTVAALVSAGTAYSQSAEPTKVKMVASLPTLTSAADYLMHVQGFDKEHGIELEVAQTGGSSSLQIDAVLAGSAAFGAPGTATALQAIREGADLKIIGAVAKNQIAAVMSNDAIKKSGIAPDAPFAERIKVMKGMTIGTNPIGATYYQMLRYYLQQNGIDPDKDVRLVGIGESSALISGMEQGRFDAIVSASGIVEQAISLGAGQLWFSGARGDVPGGNASVVSVVVVRSDTAEKNPKLIDSFRAGMEDSLKALREDRVEMGKVLQQQFFSKLDPKVWEMVWTNAKDAYPSEFSFTREAYDFWTGIDPKGPGSYSKVSYADITYAASRRE